MSAGPHPAQCCCDASPGLQATRGSLVLAKRVLGKRRREWDDVMAFLVDRELLGRANRALLIGVVGGGLVACALGASIYDIGDWLDMW
jgi:hypothetical protein